MAKRSEWEANGRRLVVDAGPPGAIAEAAFAGEKRRSYGSGGDYGWSVDEGLAQIDRLVLQLFAVIGENVAGATHAFLSGDREEGKILADQDEVVDRIYREAEALTLEQMHDRSRGDDDLRFLITVLRMLPDLERNGDLAEHVARRAARGLGMELSARSRGLVERMG